MTADEAEVRGIEPWRKIVSRATAGVDPAVIGGGPFPALSTCEPMETGPADWRQESNYLSRMMQYGY
jgi:hypothetical protein